MTAAALPVYGMPTSRADIMMSGRGRHRVQGSRVERSPTTANPAWRWYSNQRDRKETDGALTRYGFVLAFGSAKWWQWGHLNFLGTRMAVGTMHLEHQIRGQKSHPRVPISWQRLQNYNSRQ